MGKLDSKVAIITGAGGGIGQAAARLFAAEGAKLMLVDLNEEALVVLAKSLGEDKAGYTVADVSRVSDVQAYLKNTMEQFGRVDITLLNAGIEGRVASISDQTEEDFDRVMAINTRGVWLGLKYTMPIMAENGGGSIVITSSTAGIRAVPGLSPYIASKHAVIGLMRAGAMEGAKDKVRVNTVNPAPVETDMMRIIEDGMDSVSEEDNPKAKIEESIPLGRYAQPEEIAKLMLFLSSDDSSFVTGSVYLADGGSTA